MQVIVTVCLLLAACGGPVDGVTAEQITRDAAVRSRDAATQTTFRTLASRAALRGQLVAYHMCQAATATQPAQAILGYSVVRSELGATGIKEAWERTSSTPFVGARVEYDVGGGPGTQLDYTLVFGRALSPDVRAVEAVFADGRTVRDEVAAGGGFAVLSEEPVEVQAVRLLGDNGQLIEQLEHQQGLHPLAGNEQSGPCVP